MRTPAFFLLMAFLTVLPCAITSCAKTEWPAGCPHGEVWLPNFEDPDTPGAYFDFSAGELVYGEEGRRRGDIYLDHTFIAGNPTLGVALQDAQPDSILYDRTAPSWGSEHWKGPIDQDSPGRVPIYDGHNIWVQTAENHTAKLHILLVEANENYSSYLRIKFEWIYQPDGSTEFHDIPGAVEGETQAPSG